MLLVASLPCHIPPEGPSISDENVTLPLCAYVEGFGQSGHIITIMCMKVLLYYLCWAHIYFLPVVGISTLACCSSG